MYEKLFVGKNAASATAAPAFDAISKIILLVDDENEFVSGDDNGRALELSCPYGNQEMADNLLAQLGGYVYQPMAAGDALLDPAAEIGDSVTVNGVYTILAQIDRTFDLHCAADIAAPGEEELESEYQYKSQSQREFDRKLAQTRSLISKTAEEIRLEVEGFDGRLTSLSLDVDGLSAEVQGLEGEYTALALTVDGFTITDSTGTTKIKGSSIDTSTLNVDNINIDLAGRIAFTDLTDYEDVQADIDTALGYADEALTAAEDAADTVDAWRYNGGTYIDGSMLKTGTVMASYLLGGEVGLLTASESVAGGMEITGSSSSTYAIELYSNRALRLCAYGTYAAVWIEAGEAAAIGIQTVDSLGYNITMNRSVIATGSSCYMGRPSYPWAGVYSETDPVITSDRNKKKDITYGLDAYDGFFDGLQSGEYRLKNGTSGRKHWGFVAQDIRDNLDKHGIPTADFGGYVEDVDKDGNPIYGLRYGEFIALLVDQVQKLKARVARLEGVKA